MYSIELRNQMVIHKAKKTSLTVSTKSTVSFVTVWGLWTLSFYLIAKDHHFLFNNPIVLHWTLGNPEGRVGLRFNPVGDFAGMEPLCPPSDEIPPQIPFRARQLSARPSENGLSDGLY